MRTISPIWAAAAALTCGLAAVACNQSPIAPSPSAVQPPTAPSASAVQPGAAETMSESALINEAVSLSPADFAARGWDCRPAPTIPNRVTCSPPNQGHPVLLPGPPPPDDRPATFALLVFDSGVFTGTDLLIRSDLYHGQQCHSTGAPYRFIARIGYYECLHFVNGG
jgi:hypothetical protein